MPYEWALHFLQWIWAALGMFHTCALLDSGQVKCWGSNSEGQLGLGDTISRGIAPGQMSDALPVVDLGTRRTAVSIAAGGIHTCALLDNGKVKCWGWNGYGQLGFGDTDTRGNEPGEMGNALVTVDVGSYRVLSVRTGWAQTCTTLEGGQLKCWGNNIDAQLGLGDNTTRGIIAGQMVTIFQ